VRRRRCLSLSPFATDESAIAAFEKLLGRQSTPAEREQLFRVKEALGLRENDALWLILFALQYYESLYRLSIGVEKGPPIGMEKGPLLIIGSGLSPESIEGTRA